MSTGRPITTTVSTEVIGMCPLSKPWKGRTESVVETIKTTAA